MKVVQRYNGYVIIGIGLTMDLQTLKKRKRSYSRYWSFGVIDVFEQFIFIVKNRC